jgi:hypothetical protein
MDAAFGQCCDELTRRLGIGRFQIAIVKNYQELPVCLVVRERPACLFERGCQSCATTVIQAGEPPVPQQVRTDRQIADAYHGRLVVKGGDADSNPGLFCRHHQPHGGSQCSCHSGSRTVRTLHTGTHVDQDKPGLTGFGRLGQARFKETISATKSALDIEISPAVMWTSAGVDLWWAE